jgi:hypothetical protein
MTKISLNQVSLEQEVTGSQVREVSVMGATLSDLDDLLRDTESSAFREGIQMNIGDQVHFGLGVFQSTITSTKKVLPNESDAGSYQYSAGDSP